MSLLSLQYTDKSSACAEQNLYLVTEFYKKLYYKVPDCQKLTKNFKTPAEAENKPNWNSETI